MPFVLSSLHTDGGYGGSDWSYRRGTVGGMTSRGYGRYGGYGGYDDYCASPPVHKRAKRPFSHALCVFVVCRRRRRLRPDARWLRPRRTLRRIR